MKIDPKLKLTCLIVDDNKAAHELLLMHIKDVEYLSYCGSCYDGVQALTMIQRLIPDIVFLDVQIPRLSGIELMQILGKTSSSIIMITGYAKYAIEGYNYDVVDFIEKPFEFPRFLRAINRVCERRSLYAAMQPLSLMADQRETENDPMDDLQAAKQQSLQGKINFPVYTDKCIWIKANKKQIPLDYGEICCIEASGNYCIFYATEDTHRTRVTISELLDNLPSDLFAQTQRAFIVNRDAIKELEGNELLMINDVKARVSEEFRSEIFKVVNKRYG
ncbi:LytR/AlgR family response regulator transcription factor [Dyadobacter psychrotolerans]|uniref:Response regulator transcription factor n=1 Tax=Dyadobacter psychrotolerans TaxID=2541721 RepID=A0A4R5D9U5_9BACT|nr:response regulator transcription factor [Dyadobacter psychrotolerans]TDE09557.1 response regulator transcription factor [Dyadobacter psychrotolerans]